jgi:hypothetical protein
MKQTLSSNTLRALIAGSFLAAHSIDARADAVTDWNQRAGEILSEAKLGTPPAVRAMAIVQTAVSEAVANARGANVDAAVAAANRATLSRLVPAQQASIDAAYRAAIAPLGDGDGMKAGIEAGEQAAAAVLARRAGDTPSADEYRPHAAPGAYVPTAMPAVPTWSSRKPWLMPTASAFRPSAPPALTSDAWVRDYNEIQSMGGRASTKRTPEQSDIARFWDYSLPPIYYGVVRSVALAPGRDVARNARLFAAVAQAMDDSLISVFEAKYHYNFWRPVTAIRNGDQDGNDATQRDASWAPLVDSPLHPEYPSGHSILAGSVATVLEADIGSGPMPQLVTSSPTLKGATRRWSSPREFMEEVSNARVYAGIHFRSATDAGMAMGRKIGGLAAKSLAPANVASTQ